MQAQLTNLTEVLQEDRLPIDRGAPRRLPTNAGPAHHKNAQNNCYRGQRKTLRQTADFVNQSASFARR